MKTTTTLRDVSAAGLTHLAIDCTKCPRAGRYRVATLEARFGADASMVDVLRTLSADCPRRATTVGMDVCGARSQDLLRVA